MRPRHHDADTRFGVRPRSPHSADIADRARARRIEPTPSLARSLHEWTGGALTHVDAGLAAARHGEAGVRAAVIAHLQDVLQHLDGDVVAALALHLYGGGTDAGDLAPALDISPDRRRRWPTGSARAPS